jgi:hypothetical protein
MKNMDVRSLFHAAAAIAVMCGTSAAHAAVLTAVPMQGGMVMPMVSYNAAVGKIQVMMPAEFPQLTPLLVSNPADSFDPADPWFDELDPSRRGASFSRRYGFVMGAMSDPLPEGTQMWIRRLSGSPELKYYRYAASVPKAFDPIFGTDGVTNALYWDANMFHPAVAAPPGTSSFTATFEVYLLDTTTGQPLPNSSSGPLVFDWTNVPDGRPALSIAQKVVVVWPPATTTNWVLESASSANATAWTLVTNAAVIVDDEPCVVLDSGDAQQYFRMRYFP